MSRLTAAQRRALPASAFGVPSKAPGPGSYPMPDRKHAILAEGFAARFASPAEKKKVDAKAKHKTGDVHEALMRRRHKKHKKVLHDSRGDTYTAGAKFDSAGDRIVGKRDSRGDRTA